MQYPIENKTSKGQWSTLPINNYNWQQCKGNDCSEMHHMTIKQPKKILEQAKIGRNGNSACGTEQLENMP